MIEKPAPVDLPVQANYSKPGYPVLGFLYALYCDGKADSELDQPTDESFSNKEFKLWRDAGARHKDEKEDYRGYLDSYVTGERPFPSEAESLSVVDVADLGTKHVVRLTGEAFDSVRYVPTLETGLKMTLHVIAEITNSPAQEGRQREPMLRQTEAREAKLSAAAPLLSTLAVMFLEGDLSVWDHYVKEKGFAPAVLAVLEKFFLNEPVGADEAKVLSEPLALELSSPPAVW